MKFVIAVTNVHWFEFLRTRAPQANEVNFWGRGAVNLERGTPWLFKLKGHDVVCGGGFYTNSISLPLTVAWDMYGEQNGAASLHDFQSDTGRSLGDEIACRTLAEPFFWERAQWLPKPPRWASSGIQSRKYYDTADPDAAAYWALVAAQLPKKISLAAAIPAGYWMRISSALGSDG